MPSFPGPYLTPVKSWDDVHEFQSTDDLQGGSGQIDNWPSQALANRDEFLLDKMLGDFIQKVQYVTVPIGGGTPIMPTNTDRGTLYVIERGSIAMGIYLPDISTVDDGAAFGIKCSNGYFETSGAFFPFGADEIHDNDYPAPSDISSFYSVPDGLCIVKKFPGATKWTVVVRAGTSEPGTIAMHRTGAPSLYGWLVCSGLSISTSQYPQLFDKIGYTFGGSGPTFNVPTITSGVSNVSFYIHV